MKKYLAWFAFVFIVSIAVDLKHENYANKSAANSRKEGFSVFLDDAPKCKDYSPDPNDNAAVWWERGYVFFGWPAGTTIWALVITFAVIGEQTGQVSRSAKATEDSLTEIRTQAGHMDGQLTEMKLQREQAADFFRAEKRPWVGILGSVSLRDKKTTKPGYFGFTLEYVVKNFGVAPAFNTVVPFGIIVEGEDVNNYALVGSRVDDARKRGENIVAMTGDLLLPGQERAGTCEFSAIQGQKIAVTGCIVYRFSDGTIHHTELSYWIDLAEGEKAKISTLWFQDAN